MPMHRLNYGSIKIDWHLPTNIPGIGRVRINCRLLHQVIPASIHIYESAKHDDSAQFQTEVEAACTCGLTYHVIGDSLTAAVQRLEAEFIEHIGNARRAGEPVQGWPILPQ
jgi:hypothetical protein